MMNAKKYIRFAINTILDTSCSPGAGDKGQRSHKYFYGQVMDGWMEIFYVTERVPTVLLLPSVHISITVA